MHKIIPTQIDKLFDNYILIAQRLERSVCPSFENMMMHLDAMVHFRCVLNERLLENGPDSLLHLLHETGIDYQGYRFWLDDAHQLCVNKAPAVRKS